jgi:predicted dehydrogenase
MAEPLNIGLIGCGTIGRIHAAAIEQTPGCRVVAACDIDPAALARLADERASRGESYSGDFTTDDYRVLLTEKGIDAVTVGLPNYLHAPVTIDALRAGKHVFCEKPIATSFADAVAMAEEAKRADRRLVIGVVNRYHDSVNQIKSIVERGEIGEVYQVAARFKAYRSIPGLGGWFTDKARAGGGVMSDWGVHFIDLIFYILGSPPVKSVSGKCYNVLGRNLREYRFLDMWGSRPNYDGVCDVEEFAAGLIRTDGPLITFEGAWAQNINERAMYIDFLGSKGGIRHDYVGGFTVWSQTSDYLTETRPIKKDSDFYVNEFVGFVESIRSGTPNRADIDRVLPSQQVIDLFYESSREDREVMASDATDVGDRDRR